MSNLHYQRCQNCWLPEFLCDCMPSCQRCGNEIDAGAVNVREVCSRCYCGNEHD
jgi:hypothetical protein